MDYMSVEEAAQKWGIPVRSVQLHCQKGNRYHPMNEERP